MPVVSKHIDSSSQWRQIGLRIHPDVRKALKAAAALAGESMEDTLHRILTRELLPGVSARDSLPTENIGRHRKD